MWRILGILVLFILFSPLAAGAAEVPTGKYKCFCDYIQQDPGTNECNKNEDISVELGQTWKVELTKTKFYGQPGAYDIVVKDASGTFTEEWETNLGTEANPTKIKEGESKTVEVKASGTIPKCENLLYSAGQQGVVCSYNCHEEAEVLKDYIKPNGDPGKKQEWIKWDNEKIEISCLNCNPGEGTSVENLGDGKANVKFDTSKKDWLTGKVELKIQASVSGAPNAAPLLGSVWFDLEGVATLPTGADVDAWISSQYGAPPGYVARGGAIPECAFSGTCDNINDLLKLIINFASGMFAIIGSFAFAFFVYGGFKMIVSMGSPEKVKSGKDAMIAAVIGMVIAFSAYAAINLLLTTLGVDPNSEFREIK